MSVQGVSRWHRPPASTGGTRRACTLYLSAETGFVEDAALYTIVPFDSFSGEDWRNSDALDSTPFGAGTVSAGKAIVIPDDIPADSEVFISFEAGIAGGDLAPDSTGQYGLQLVGILNDGDWPTYTGIQNVLMGPNPEPDGGNTVVVHIAMPSRVHPVLVSPGDYFYLAMWTIGDAGSGNFVAGRASLTIEYFRTP